MLAWTDTWLKVEQERQYQTLQGKDKHFSFSKYCT